jgi:hypothetical protein
MADDAVGQTGTEATMLNADENQVTGVAETMPAAEGAGRNESFGATESSATTTTESKKRKIKSTANEEWYTDDGRFYNDCSIVNMHKKVQAKDMTVRFQAMRGSVNETCDLETFTSTGIWPLINITEKSLRALPDCVKTLHTTLLTVTSQKTDPYEMKDGSLLDSLNTAPLLGDANPIEWWVKMKEHFDWENVCTEATDLVKHLGEVNRKYTGAMDKEARPTKIKKSAVPVAPTAQAEEPKYKSFSETVNNWKSMEHATAIPSNGAYGSGEVFYNEKLALLLLNARGNHADQKGYVQGAVAGAQALDTFISKLCGLSH